MRVLLLLGTLEFACAELLIDPSAASVQFSGFGALSGGGATSKLLPSYPEKERNEVLDLLFKPKGLAALQILKVEIGGDTCSTEGSELSHMHSANDLDCTRGYEWWLMKEAVARNPAIKLYGLPWGFPHFLGGPTGNPLENEEATANYIVQWLKCAGTHGLNISFMGPWNEKDDEFASAGPKYLKTLRSQLDSNGFRMTQIVAGDVHTWAPATEMLKDPVLMGTVDVLGRHYPGSQSTSDAKKTGKPLWSSEDYAADNANSGGRCLARLLNQNWVDGQISGTIAWNLISSYYEWLAWAGDGLMIARSPWSGHFVVQPPMYAAAHTTQFAEPGWMLAQVGSGSGTLPKGGTYVTYIKGDQVSIVIEKVQPQKSSCGFQTTPSYEVAAETARFTLAKPLQGKVLKLSQWRSNFDGNNFFERLQDVEIASDGSFSVVVAVDDLISLTTTSGQNDGSKGIVPPKDAPFPAVHSEDFEDMAVGQEADLFASMSGGFEITQDTSDTNNKVLRQSGVGFPVKWLRNDIRPWTQIGDPQWKDANASCRMLIEDSGKGGFIGIRAQLSGTDGKGFFFGLVAGSESSKGKWFIAGSITDIGSSEKWLAHGAADVQAGSWHKMQLRAQGEAVVASLDEKEVTAVNSPTESGNAVMGAIDYTGVQFDDFFLSATSVAPGPGPSPTPPPLPTPPEPKNCKDPVAGQLLHIWGCGPDTTRRSWTIHANATIELSKSGLCIGLKKAQCSGGECALLVPCSNAATLSVSAQGGTYGQITTTIGEQVKCLDWDAAGTSAPQAHAIDVYACNSAYRGGANQRWAYDQATGALSSGLFSSESSCLAVCDPASELSWLV